MTKKKRVIVTLDDEIYSILCKAVDKYGSSKSSVINNALFHYGIEHDLVFNRFIFDDDLPPGLKKLGCK